MNLGKVDFGKYGCIRTDTRKKMWLLPMADTRSIFKAVLEFETDGTAKISQFHNLYTGWPTPRFVNEEYKRGGSILHDNLQSEKEVVVIIEKYKK